MYEYMQRVQDALNKGIRPPNLKDVTQLRAQNNRMGASLRGSFHQKSSFVEMSPEVSINTQTEPKA